MKRSCATCEYSAKHPSTGQLQCRYNPPVVLSVAVRPEAQGVMAAITPPIQWIIDGAFPSVSEKFWCSKYEQRITDKFSEIELQTGARN